MCPRVMCPRVMCPRVMCPPVMCPRVMCPCSAAYRRTIDAEDARRTRHVVTGVLEHAVYVPARDLVHGCAAVAQQCGQRIEDARCSIGHVIQRPIRAT